MSRSRYYPGRRIDRRMSGWEARWRARRDDLRSGVGRVRVYGARKYKRPINIWALFARPAREPLITETPMWGILNSGRISYEAVKTTPEQVEAWSKALAKHHGKKRKCEAED